MQFVVKCAFSALGTCLLAAVSASAATINGPVWPGPGVPSPTTAGTGSGDLGGKTFTYAPIDTTQFSNLWFGTWAGTNVSLSMDGSAHNMTFAGFSGNTATWTGTTADPYLTGTRSVDTEFVMTANMPFVDATTIGLTNGADAQITGNTFVVNFSFMARDANTTNAFIPANTYYNQDNHPVHLLSSSISGAFYYTDPAVASAVPLPSSVWGLLVLISGLGLARLKSKSARA